MRRRTFLGTPAVAGLAMQGGASAAPVDIPKRVFGKTGEKLTIIGQAGGRFPMTSYEEAKAITRSFESLSQAAAEAASARVYAGIHFREGCNAGVRQGTQIARFVVQHALKPRKR